MLSTCRVVLVTVTLALVGGCTGDEEGSLAADGLVSCAHSAAWGQVKTVTPEGGRLRVVVEADRWLVPESGAEAFAFLADDPATEAGAPAWRPGDRGLLILDESSPPALYPDEAGQELERAWRDAGARTLTDCPA